MKQDQYNNNTQKFFINKSVEGKIQSQHQYADIGAYRTDF